MPPGAAILTLDNGTSSTKAVLWSLEGQVLAEINLPYALDRPQAGGSSAAARSQPAHDLG